MPLKMRLVLLVVATSLLTLSGPASATHNRPQGVMTPNPISWYFPTHGSLETRSLSGNFQVNSFTTYWAEEAALVGLNGRQSAYEHVTMTPVNDVTQCYLGNEYGNWESNYPVAYEDTALSDNGGEGSNRNRGGGAADSRPLSPGKWYYFEQVLLETQGCDNGPPGQRMKVVAQDSVKPQDGRQYGCAFGYQYCIFSEHQQRDVVPYSAAYFQEESHSWASNQLENPTFAGGASGWYSANGVGYAMTGAGNRDSYYLRSACYQGRSTCSVYRNVGFPLVIDTDHFNTEADFRCSYRQPDQSCTVRLLLAAVDFNGYNAEWVYTKAIEIPDDRRWYTISFEAWDFGEISGSTFEVYEDLRIYMQILEPNTWVDMDHVTVHWTDGYGPYRAD